MFTEKFPLNQRIKQITLSMDEIHFYLNDYHIPEFIQDYQPLNKKEHLAFIDTRINLFSEVNDQVLAYKHFHEFAYGITPEHLQNILGQIRDDDLTATQKKQFLDDYSQYCLENLLRYFHYCAAPFKKLLQAIKEIETSTEQDMPIFAELCRQSNFYISAEEQHRVLPVYFNAHEVWIYSEQAKELFINLIDCCLFITELDHKIALLEESDDLNWVTLSQEIRDSATLIRSISFPQLYDLPLLLEKELRELFIDSYDAPFAWFEQLMAQTRLEPASYAILLKTYPADAKAISSHERAYLLNPPPSLN